MIPDLSTLYSMILGGFINQPYSSCPTVSSHLQLEAIQLCGFLQAVALELMHSLKHLWLNVLLIALI